MSQSEKGINMHYIRFLFIYILLKGKVILNKKSVAGVTSLSLNYTALVREQCSADCITLHDYHSMDSSWSHAKAL